MVQKLVQTIRMIVNGKTMFGNPMQLVRQDKSILPAPSTKRKRRRNRSIRVRLVFLLWLMFGRVDRLEWLHAYLTYSPYRTSNQTYGAKKPLIHFIDHQSAQSNQQVRQISSFSSSCSSLVNRFRILLLLLNEIQVKIQFSPSRQIFVGTCSRAQSGTVMLCCSTNVCLLRFLYLFVMIIVWLKILHLVRRLMVLWNNGWIDRSFSLLEIKIHSSSSSLFLFWQIGDLTRRRTKDSKLYPRGISIMIVNKENETLLGVDQA